MEKDLAQYKKAWGEQDVTTLELLRAKHPEDARFNLHLSLIDLSADRGQDFTFVNQEHKDLVRALGLDGVSQFLDLLERGNTRKLQAYVDSLPEDNELKSSMQKLLKYV